MIFDTILGSEEAIQLCNIDFHIIQIRYNTNVLHGCSFSNYSPIPITSIKVGHIY